MAASTQMTSTAKTLTAYYAALDSSLADTIALYELDAAISGIPFSDADRKGPEETRKEIEKRKEMASALTELAASMTKLSGLKAASDVSTAATKLGNELITVNALPAGSPVPDALGKAGNFLIQIAQARDEKKAAQAMDDTLKAMAELFEKEKPGYDTIFRTHLRQAGVVAKDLIAAGGVDPSPMLTPALKPFGLSALPPSMELRTSLLKLQDSRLQSSAAEATRKEEAASKAMLECLQEMSKRVHLLADGKPMTLRGQPLSLSVVEDWVQYRAQALI